MRIDVYRRFHIVVELDRLFTLYTLFAFNADPLDLLTNVYILGPKIGTRFRQMVGCTACPLTLSICPQTIQKMPEWFY